MAEGARDLGEGGDEVGEPGEGRWRVRLLEEGGGGELSSLCRVGAVGAFSASDSCSEVPAVRWSAWRILGTSAWECRSSWPTLAHKLPEGASKRVGLQEQPAHGLQAIFYVNGFRVRTFQNTPSQEGRD
jgi:hypothetical protein